MKKEEFDDDGTKSTMAEWKVYYFILEGAVLTILNECPKRADKSVISLNSVRIQIDKPISSQTPFKKGLFDVRMGFMDDWKKSNMSLNSDVKVRKNNSASYQFPVNVTPLQKKHGDESSIGVSENMLKKSFAAHKLADDNPLSGSEGQLEHKANPALALSKNCSQASIYSRSTDSGSEWKLSLSEDRIMVQILFSS
jgi:hypothetical protein